MDEPVQEAMQSRSVTDTGSAKIVIIGIVVEASLVLVAVILGWFWQEPVWQDLGGETAGETLQAVVIGLSATCPMLIVLVLSRRLPYGPLRRLSEVVDERILPLFANASLAGLFLLSVAAGLGEELLFRAVFQDVLANWFGGWWGACWALLLASLLFGLCHWITPAYGLFATLVGCYLGLLYWVSGDLLTAVVAHAVYDWLALVWLCRGGGRARLRAPEEIVSEVASQQKSGGP